MTTLYVLFRMEGGKPRYLNTYTRIGDAKGTVTARVGHGDWRELRPGLIARDGYRIVTVTANPL